MKVEGYEGHLENLDGGYTVGFEKYAQDADLSPFFAGLPDNRCQAEHWGYVISGKVKFTGAAGEETFEAGDAYYVPPGHTPNALCRDGGRRIQPDRRAAAHTPGRHEEHGGHR